MKKHKTNKGFFPLYGLFLFFILSSPNTPFAHVATDGTMGPAQALSGPDYQIAHELGTTAGRNLFHSFQYFSIARTESATFTGPDFISNVISRVTGGDVSSIDGVVRSQVGQADFFFINPAGVVFGPNAVVDVPGAFHVTTADELRFADGNIFSSVNPDASTLTVADPSSFGFLSPRPAAIVLNGARLAFAPESTVTLAGGDVSIKGSENREAGLTCQGGEILIQAMGEVKGDVPVSGNASFDMQGEIQLEMAHVTSRGNGGGKITAQAGAMVLDAATLAADNTGKQTPEGGIELLVDGDLTLSHGSRVETNVFDQGDSGIIQVKAKNLLIEQEEESLTGLFSVVDPGVNGHAGGIVVDLVEDLQMLGFGAIASSTYGGGSAGDVLIKACNLTINNPNFDLFTGIFSQAEAGSTGNAGMVDIDVHGRLEILGNNAYISTKTLGEGAGGYLCAQADSLFIDAKNGSGGITSSTSGSGEGGVLDIDVTGSMAFLNGGVLLNSSFADGDAGDIAIHAQDICLTGAGVFNSGFQSDTHGNGNAGNVNVSANGCLKILNGAVVSSSTWSHCHAGSVIVNAGELTIDKQGSEWLTGVFSQANSESAGNAGDVTIHAGDICLMGDGDYNSGFLSETLGPGDAGSVNVFTDGSLEILNGAVISSSTSSEGHAGNVVVNAERVNHQQPGFGLSHRNHQSG